MMIETRTEPASVFRTALDALLASRKTHAESWDALGVFAVRAGSAALLFLTQMVLARWMGASEFGHYVSAWTAVIVVGGVSHLGFNVAMMRLGPQYHANKDYAAFRGLLRGGRLVSIVSSTVIALIGAVALWVFDAHHTTSLAWPLAIALLCLPVFALIDVQDCFGRGQGWTMEGIVPPYIVRPIVLLVMVAGASIFGFGADATTGMAIALAATVVAVVLQTVLIERRVKDAIPVVPPRYDYPAWFRISMPLLAGGICELVVQNADVLLLNFFQPADEVGHYYAAAKTAGLALFIHYAVASAYAGRIAAAHSIGDTAAVHALVSSSVRWTFIPTATVVAGILIVGYPVLAQFGDSFTDAYPLMFILAAGIMAKAATGPSDTILNMLGHQRASAISMALAAVLCVVLNIVLVQLWGVTGAAVATTSAITASSLFNWYAARRLEGLNIFVLAHLGGARAKEASR